MGGLCALERFQNGDHEMKLVQEWKKCWRMFSVQAMVLVTAIQGAWVFIPPEMQAALPETWVRVITVILLVLGVVGRLIVQPKVSEQT